MSDTADIDGEVIRPRWLRDVAALKVKPGDVVVVRCDEKWDGDIDEVGLHLLSMFPSTPYVVFRHGFDIEVVRPRSNNPLGVQIMPHYADGRPAKIGDRVRGKGYNLKDAQGNLREFEGIVVGVTPGSETCNIKIANLRAGEGKYNDAEGVERSSFNSGAIHAGDSAVVIDVEYGQCDHFNKIE